MFSKLSVGTLYVDEKPLKNPKIPVWGGDIPYYDGCSTFSLGDTVSDRAITWLEVKGSNILVADRVLLTSVSWHMLEKNGFVEGVPITLAGQSYLCRLPKLGKRCDTQNEWDALLDIVGEDNNLVNWDEMAFWGLEKHGICGDRYVVRAYDEPRTWDFADGSSRFPNIGFRPVLERI